MPLYDDYDELFKKWGKVALHQPLVPPRPFTFMEVMGYPHWENVWSNILGFFFDDRNEHGMKNLWARSLIECLNNIDKDNNFNIDNVFNIETDREYSTEKGRIDIILHNEEYIIGIENKVASVLQNDLNDYAKTINEKALAMECKPLYILLSVRNEEETLSKQYPQGNWKNITYDCLFDNVMKNFGEYAEDADDKWIIFMKDFILTGRNKIHQMKGEINMCFNENDLNFMKFWGKNEKRINGFLDDRDIIKRKIKNQIDYLVGVGNGIESIQSSKDNLPPGCTSSKIKAWHPANELCESAYIEIEFSERLFVVEALLDYEWRVIIWDRNNNSLQYNTDLLNKIKNLKQSTESNKREDSKRVVLESFEINEKIEILSPKILEAMRRGIEIVAKLVNNP